MLMLLIEVIVQLVVVVMVLRGVARGGPRPLVPVMTPGVGMVVVVVVGVHYLMSCIAGG